MCEVDLWEWRVSVRVGPKMKENPINFFFPIRIKKVESRGETMSH